MQRLSLTLVLVLFTAALPAAVAVNGGGQAPTTNTGNNDQRNGTAPAWVADPTEGGKRKAVTFSWAANATKEEQKQARADAYAALIKAFQLPATVKAKELNLWVDPSGKTYVQYVAR